MLPTKSGRAGGFGQVIVLRGIVQTLLVDIAKYYLLLQYCFLLRYSFFDVNLKANFANEVY